MTKHFKSGSPWRNCHAAFLAAVFVFVPAIVTAQGVATPPGKLPDPRKDAPVHAGPVYLEPRFTVRDLGVDTNVFNSATDPRSDFTVTLVPALKALVPYQRRALLTTSLAGGFAYFAHFSGERSFDPEALVRGDLFARRMTFYAENSFRNTRERPSLEIDARSRHRNNQAAIGFAAAVASKLSVELGAYRRTTKYEQDEVFFGTNLATALNRREEGLKLQLSDRLTSRTSVGLSVVTTKVRFDANEARNKDVDGFRIEPVIDLAPTALISGRFSFGYRRLDGLSPTLPEFHGMVANTRLGYTLLGATNFEVNWNRDVDFSFEQTNPYYVLGVLGGRVRRQLVRNFDVGASLTRATYTYESTAVPAPLIQRVDVTKSTALLLGYRINRQTRFDLSIARQTRSSNRVGSRDYQQWKIGSAITYAVQ